MATPEILKRYGLVGYPLSHSFSPGWFKEFFRNNSLKEYLYELYPLTSPSHLPNLVKEDETLNGLNVTIPYKESIIPYLDFITGRAASVGAVNTIKIVRKEATIQLIGHNTDVDGFDYLLQSYLNPTQEHSMSNDKSLLEVETDFTRLITAQSFLDANKEENKNDFILPPIDSTSSKSAIILGSGGASKAVRYSLLKHNIPYIIVSRNPVGCHEISYEEFEKISPQNYNLIINTTPLGTKGEYETKKPAIDYNKLTQQHHLIDLVYNPAITPFLKAGLTSGTTASNGKKMLIRQAEASWFFWCK